MSSGAAVTAAPFSHAQRTTGSTSIVCAMHCTSTTCRSTHTSWWPTTSWSSHRANACGDHDPVVTPHSLCLALAVGAEERRDAYRRMFGQPLAEDTVGAIREATRFEWSLGGTAFRRLAEESGGRRTDRLPMGRPRNGVPRKVVS